MFFHIAKKLGLHSLSVLAVQCCLVFSVAAQNTQYAEIEEPTADRPYYLVTFDSETMREHPDWTPVSIEGLHDDKLVVLNFIKEGDQFSDIQTQVLDETMTKVARRSVCKDLMLVNVHISDAVDNPIYAAAYAVYYEQNTLLEDQSRMEDRLIPYGVVFGSSVTTLDNDFRQLADFALLRGVVTPADFNENVKAIRGFVISPALSYNELCLKN